MRKLILSIATAVIFISFTTQAAELVRYSFGVTGDETTVETSPAFGATLFDPHLTATPIQDPLNTVGIEISSAATTPAGAPFLRLDPQGGSTSAAGAIAANKYFQFTLSPEAGYRLALESIGFQVTRGGGATPRGYVLRSSVDNFTADLAGGDLTTARPTYTDVSVTFGPSFSDLTAPVTFRLYNYAPAAGNSVDYDNFTLSGTITAVPEPGVMTIGIIGGLALALTTLRHRRK